MDVVAGAGAFCADGRAAVVSLLEARLFGLPASYWAPIATLVITQPSLGRTLHGLSHFIGLPKCPSELGSRCCWRWSGPRRKPHQRAKMDFQSSPTERMASWRKE
jgi:hypothetical protein